MVQMAAGLKSKTKAFYRTNQGQVARTRTGASGEQEQVPLLKNGFTGEFRHPNKREHTESCSSSTWHWIKRALREVDFVHPEDIVVRNRGRSIDFMVLSDMTKMFYTLFECERHDLGHLDMAADGAFRGWSQTPGGYVQNEYDDLTFAGKRMLALRWCQRDTCIVCYFPDQRCVGVLPRECLVLNEPITWTWSKKHQLTFNWLAHPIMGKEYDLLSDTEEMQAGTLSDDYSDLLASRGIAQRRTHASSENKHLEDHLREDVNGAHLFIALSAESRRKIKFIERYLCDPPT
jgi:hypothetical protein